MPKYVLLYESADDVRSKAPLHFPAHVARWKEFRDQGTLLPFVLNGVVCRWSIREWNEAMGSVGS
jgi:uncharacterized protein YciI